jgi:hypothetical protein
VASKTRQDWGTAISAAEDIPPNGSLYLLYAVDLATVTRNAVDTLYCSDAARRPWLEIQSAITEFKLQDFHGEYPAKPGPPIRLQQWIDAALRDEFLDDHPDDSKPALPPRD